MSKDKRYTCSATLDLVCPPISNSLAAQKTNDDRVKSIIKQSDFYMICGRPQATFCDIVQDSTDRKLYFSIDIAGVQKDSGCICLDIIPYVALNDKDTSLRVTFRKTQIALFAPKEDGGEEVIASFTPDEILMRRGRKEMLVEGFDCYLELATYDLLYVGIAKKGDTYERLFAKGHNARMQILANEPQRYPGARVSDETYLFAFKVEPLLITTFGPESDIEERDLIVNYDAKKLVADAEKAIISLLKPSYNSTLYGNYPKGKDGLYGAGYHSYTYAISEGMAFRTSYGTIKGGREREMTMSNQADYILVEGNDVSFRISGVDFPATSF